MIGGTVSNAVNAAFSQTETFESNAGYSTTRPFVVSLVTLVIMLALILLLGKYLWNNVLTSLIPAVKPAKSIWQILGLAVLIGLMYPGYCC